MRLIDVLPDKWGDVAYRRYRKLRDETLQSIKGSLATIEGCMDCPCFDVSINGNYIATRCRVTKCIKQYPHIYDNEEFK